jgi:hypothetical protein
VITKIMVKQTMVNRNMKDGFLRFTSASPLVLSPQDSGYEVE